MEIKNNLFNDPFKESSRNVPRSVFSINRFISNESDSTGAHLEYGMTRKPSMYADRRIKEQYLNIYMNSLNRSRKILRSRFFTNALSNLKNSREEISRV